MSEKGILKKIDDIFNYCEEIDNHLPKEEQTGYSMLPDIFYIQKEVHNLQQKVEQLENIRKEAIEYLTSYESISTIQGLNDIEKNKILDEKTMNEMVNRYLKVHDNLLNILNKGDNNVKDKR